MLKALHRRWPPGRSRARSWSRSRLLRPLLALSLAAGPAGAEEMPLSAAAPGSAAAEAPQGSGAATATASSVDVDQAIDETVSSWDLGLVELMGLVAAAVASAFSLRKIRGTSTPYSLPVSLAGLKLATGALTAFLGLMLMRGNFVPGLSALDSSAQILAWAIVFGYSQQIFTRFIDRQAQSVLDSVGGHGAYPHATRDPVVIAAQVVVALQTIVSRQIDLTKAPAIVTLGIIQGGNRYNIIPEEVKLTGTIRTFDPAMRLDIHDRIKRTAENIAEAGGATATVKIEFGNVVTYNDPALTQRMGPTLKRVAGPEHWFPNGRVTTTSEDFADYQQKVPGIFFFLGITPKGADPKTVAPNHSPRFFADEAALPVGVRALSNLAVDYLAGGK